jgi:hypothetical protein
MRARIAIAASLMAMAAGAGVDNADAAVVSGSDLSGPAPTAQFCGALTPPGTFNSCTVGLAELPAAARAPGGTRAAMNGVIVSWRVRSGAAPKDLSVRLRLIRNETGVASGKIETLPHAAGTYEFAARLPVKSNDEIGIDGVNLPAPDGLIIFRAASGAFFDFWETKSLGEGEIRPASSKPESQPMLNVTIEPDADGDGFGDESQDKCAGAAGSTEGCPLAGPTPAEPVLVPNTKIAEVKIEGKKATFRFTSTVKNSKFKCKLDKKAWKSCRSPKVYRGLAEGRHTFKVKAVGPTAVPDPTPVKRTFRVKP